MELLEQRILKSGKVLPGGVLKIDSFLNHQMDPQLMHEMALELKRLFADSGVNKVLTIEASGIALAIMAGYELGCPVVFAKKSKTKNISDNVYSVEVESFTHGKVNTVLVSKEFLHPEDKVLIVDDFLATGAALIGLKALVEQAGGSVVGAGIAVEKVFQGGGNMLREQGMRIESLAMIASMDDTSLTFC